MDNFVRTVGYRSYNLLIRMEVTMELRLTDKEHELLLEVLQEHHKHLLHEINKAHHHQFKVDLRHRCEVLEGMMQKVDEPVHSAA